MHRRTFLQTAAVSTLALSAGAAGAAGAARRLRIGFLGCSHSHALSKLKLALESPDWECVGFFEPGEKHRAAAEKLGAKSLTREQVLAASEVVALEGKAQGRHELARAALLAGKHIHIEKPPTLTLGEFRELLGIAR
ncbi:MAG: Gfo/Idh/MocA family oxidoreductase, partial [Limisphaerales bacterium]